MGKRNGAVRRAQARGRVARGWSGEAQGALLGLRDWRAQHPDATLAEMEAEQFAALTPAVARPAGADSGGHGAGASSGGGERRG